MGIGENKKAASEVTLTSQVKQDLAGLSLLEYLVSRFPYKDKAAWDAELRAGTLMHNGRPGLGSQTVSLHDTVSYTAPRREPAVATDIVTLFEDEHLLVVHKPAPLPCHSDGVFITHTLIHLLRTSTGNSGLALGHRLDRETSGVLVLSKRKEATAKLMAAFDGGGAEKRYLALVQGSPAWEETEVKGWMARKGGLVSLRQSLHPQAVPGGKESATGFRVKERRGDRTLIECLPATGRTHQIRVHLEFLGLPVVGEKLYGKTDEEYVAYVRQMKKGGENANLEAGRHLLHAWKLSLPHPITGKQMQWEAPLPEAFS